MSDRDDVIDRAITPPVLTAATLLARWRSLPHVDPVRLRADLDELLDVDDLEVVEVEPAR